uniref:Thrombomodulin n=1 Tax=Pelusios castaneus TaxID=367368 RepID=A0A8C8VKK5_9SAUR
MLRLCLGLLLAASAGRSAPEPPADTLCLEPDCFGVFWGRRRFAEASGVCAAGRGRLMWVRSTVAAGATDLLAGQRRGARLWLGLQLPPGRQCTEPGRRLRGFRWAAGDELTDYVAWRQPRTHPVCGRRCVALEVGKDLVWEEERCDSELDGFLCEYNLTDFCAKLSPGAGVAVTYTPSFEGRDSDLPAMPAGTTASVPSLGLELVCQVSGDGVLQWGTASPGAWHCQLENGGCEGTCHWEQGTPLCSCPPGERLEQDQRSCASLCANAPCEHHCIPHGGSYTCMCHEGYQLAEDSVHCRDVDDCHAKPDLCDQECVNTIGGFQCRCHLGYELVEGKCEDVIDCYEEKCQHKCVDVPGGYKCTCFDGYAPDPQNPDKCVLFCNQSSCPADCDPHTEATCYCPSGFILEQTDGNKQMCVDLDECEMDYCEHLCTNEPGSYRCHCREGFVLSDQHSCSPEDEFSGDTMAYPKTAPPTRAPPKADSLHLGVLVGISIGILATILALMALFYHLMKKHCATQGDKGYKCSNSTEKELGLQQVTSGSPAANQKL